MENGLPTLVQVIFLCKVLSVIKGRDAQVLLSFLHTSEVMLVIIVADLMIQVTLWCLDKNVPVPEMTKKKPHGAIVELKRELQERLCGSGVLQDILERLISIYSKDSLLAILFHLTAKKIGFEEGFLQISEWPSDPTTDSAQLVQTLNDITLAAIPHKPVVFRPLRLQAQKDYKLTLFTKLLPELRGMVWMAIIRNGRMVQIHEGYRGGFKSACPPPVMLGIHFESRKFALKHYQVGFESRDGPDADTNIPCYFHRLYNTLYLGLRTVLFTEHSIGYLMNRMLSYDDPFR